MGSGVGSKIIDVSKLPARQVSALKRRAKRLGVTPAEYLSQLIEDDQALDRKVQRSSLDALAAPFRRAFEGVPESKVDQIVANIRRRRRTGVKSGH